MLVRVAVTGLLALVACTDAPAADDTEGAVVDLYYLNDPTPMIDVLIVVDTSPAMAPHRDALVTSYGRFAEAFEWEPGIPYLHLGVVTASLGGPGCAPGDGGVLRRAPAVAGDFIDDHPVSNVERVRNYSGDLANAIPALANAGTDGCATSQSIAAMMQALSADTGFRRPEASLMILFVSASDDASPIAIDDATAYLISIAPSGNTREVVVSVIGGPEGVGCDAAPATRLHALAERFVDRNRFTSICGAEHQDAFALVQELFRAWIGLGCVQGELMDVDPVSPGPQYDCSLSDHYPDPLGNPVERVLDPCNADATNRPCWRFGGQEPWCPSAMSLEVERPFSPVRGTETFGQCVAQTVAVP